MIILYIFNHFLYFFYILWNFAIIIIALLTRQWITENAQRLDLQPVSITEECINGVVYYNGYHKMAPAYDREGNVILCDTESQDKTVD